MSPLQRYRSVVEDWDRFWEVSHTPEPVAFRVRRGRIRPDRLTARLRRAGFVLEPVEGVEDYYRVREGPGSVAQTLEHWAGFLHIQQAVMGLPCLALEPEPGDRVLDLCAAPGGKTAHLSELMGEQGPLVAVDPKEKRIRGLLGNLYRLGCMNVLVVACDGRRLPGGALFDRVLVDAPCSGEGNYRRQEGRSASRSASFTRYATALQEALLRRAIALTRPGGVIVYSTCTYAPEENEAIIDQVLRDEPVVMENISLSVPRSPGLLEWEGRHFHPDVARAWRVYPHHLDSGGLFMARLRRSDTEPVELRGSARTRTPTESSGWSAIPFAFPGQDEAEVRSRICTGKAEYEHWFGLRASLVEGLGWMVRGKHVWANSAGEWPVARWLNEPEGRWRVVSLGLRALRAGPGSWETPSSHFLTRWGEETTPSSRVEPDEKGMRALLEGALLPVGTLSRGPVALVWDGVVLGRGVVTRAGLKHELGRLRAEALLSLLFGSPKNEIE